MTHSLAAPAAQYGALHVFIDAVHHCPGTCTGCALSGEERREKLLPINPAYLGRLFDTVREQARRVAAPSLAMVYGIGDYLRYDTTQVRHLVQQSVDLIAELSEDNGQDSVVMVSSSLIGRESHVQQAIEEVFGSITKPAHVSTVLKVVFDPLKARHGDYGPVYRDMFATVGRLVPDSDVVINLSPQVVSAIDPVTAYEMMADYGFRELELPWLITAHHAAPTRADLEALADWLVALSRISAQSPFAPLPCQLCQCWRNSCRVR